MKKQVLITGGSSGIGLELAKKCADKGFNLILVALNKDRLESAAEELREKVKVTRDMVEVEREVPEIYKESEFKFGQVYLNTERTEELEAEGYAREITRNVQQLRKQAGLEKLDQINQNIMMVHYSESKKAWEDKSKVTVKQYHILWK